MGVILEVTVSDGVAVAVLVIVGVAESVGLGVQVLSEVRVRVGVADAVALGTVGKKKGVGLFRLLLGSLGLSRPSGELSHKGKPLREPVISSRNGNAWPTRLGHKSTTTMKQRLMLGKNPSFALCSCGPRILKHILALKPYTSCFDPNNLTKYPINFLP